MGRLSLGLLLLVIAVASAQEAATSGDPRVKFKDGGRYLRDLSIALELPRETICRELSQYDCFSDAFRIVLGGVEPYSIRVVEPAETASLTAPIALDRVALHACTQRVDEDVKVPAKALLFHSPKSKSPDRKWKERTVAIIYDRILRREATSGEVSRMLSFYDTVAKDGPNDASRNWTVLACFSVASSLESVFY
jgi:hypothetical protein